MNRPADRSFTSHFFYSFDEESFDEESFNDTELKYSYFCPSCHYFVKTKFNTSLGDTTKCAKCGKIALLATCDEVEVYINPSSRFDIVGLHSIQNRFNAVKDIDYFKTSKYCIGLMSVFDYYGKKEFSLLFGRIPDSLYSKIGTTDLSSSCILLNTFGGIDFHTLESLKNQNIKDMIAYLKNEKAILEKGYPYKKWPWFKYFLFRAAYLNTNILYQGLEGNELQIYKHVFYKDKNDNSTQDCTRFYLYLSGNYEI